MKVITLKKGEILKDLISENEEIEIICNGDNIIQNCYFYKVKNKNFIKTNENCKFISNNFVEIKQNFIVKNNNEPLQLISNLFLSCNFIHYTNTKNNIFHKNRFENCEGLIDFNTSYNKFINNEIVNCKLFLDINRDNNVICFNFFDYKSLKNSKCIVLTSKDNLIKGNIFNNIEYPINIYNYTNNILDNDFVNSKTIFSLEYTDGIINDLIIENNNFCEFKKIFDKKIYEKNIINYYDNYKNEELLNYVKEIVDINEEESLIKKYRIERKLKEKKEKVEKKEKDDTLKKEDLIKLLALNNKLNDIKDLVSNLNKLIIKLEKQL